MARRLQEDQPATSPDDLRQAQDIILREGKFGISAAKTIPAGEPVVVFQLADNTFTVDPERARRIAAGIVRLCDHLEGK